MNLTIYVASLDVHPGGQRKFGILDRVSYNEVPPRVEYKVTLSGAKFIRILDELEKLQDEIENEI